MTDDFFPSFILEPKKIIENIIWFLNPIEEPPQKFLQLVVQDTETNVYSDLLMKDGFSVKNITESGLLAALNSDLEKGLQKNHFNIVFSFANDHISENLILLSSSIHSLLRPSSYFIYEIKVTENLESIKKILLRSFETVNFLTPWSQMATNPFSPFDQNQSKYCWIVALSQDSDDDPAEWLQNL